MAREQIQNGQMSEQTLVQDLLEYQNLLQHMGKPRRMSVPWIELTPISGIE